jgi:hypothetical protein
MKWDDVTFLHFRIIFYWINVMWHCNTSVTSGLVVVTSGSCLGSYTNPTYQL